MAEVKFTIKRYNGTTFDIALPKTVVEQVIEINEHLKDGDRHISAEDREALKTVAVLSAKGYAPIRNSAMATVKEYPTYTALKEDLPNLPQGTTAMVLDASDDVLVDYGYAMYRVMLDDTDNKTLIKVSDTMSMDFTLKLDNVRGFNQSAGAIDKMVEDSHFHENFALLNTLTQGMFEGLKDYQKAKTAFENTLDKVGLRSGDMAFVKVGNDPTVTTEDPVVPPPVPPQPEGTEEHRGETVTPQPEAPVNTGDTHTETEPPKPAEDKHENTESPVVPPEGETHTEQPTAPNETHTEENPVVNPGGGTTHTPSQGQGGMTPVAPAIGTTVPVTPGETHTGDNTVTPAPEAPKETEGTNNTAESSAPVENTASPAVTPEENKPVTPQPEGNTETGTTPAPAAPTGETETHTEESTGPAVTEEPHENTGSPVVTPEDNTVTPSPDAPVANETHTEQPVHTEENPAAPVVTPPEDSAVTPQPEAPVNSGDTHNEEAPANPAVGTEEKHDDAPVNDGTHTEENTVAHVVPEAPKETEGVNNTVEPSAPVVTPEGTGETHTETEHPAAPVPVEETHTSEENKPVAEENHPETSNPEEHKEGETVVEHPGTNEGQPVAPATSEDTPVVTPESGTPDSTGQPVAPVAEETHREEPPANTGETHSEESSNTPAVGTEEHTEGTPVVEDTHTEVPLTPTVPEEHAHSEASENAEGTPVATTEESSDNKPKPATPDDERFNSHLAVQPKPVEGDLPEGVSPTSGNN